MAANEPGDTPISRIAVRHGLGAYLSGRRDPSRQPRVELARRLRLALDDAGVAFVKLGQVLSTRRDGQVAEGVDEQREIGMSRRGFEYGHLDVPLLS